MTDQELAVIDTLVGDFVNLTKEARQELRRLVLKKKEEEIAYFGEIYYWLTDVFYKYDLVGLKGCDVPEDEYESEARLFLKSLEESKPENVESMTKLIKEIFEAQFGRIYENMPFEEASKEIWGKIYG